MPRIEVLPEALVNQIAAGEVVERPASVVKELVENSLDAGARRITVDVEGGGVRRIEVVDDGLGMEGEDARLALERHATSKLRSLADLMAISTLGFRGEALPSIASVSRLTLTTSPDASGLGTRVVAERGGATKAEPARHARGTRVVVEGLFENVPARRKFLKGPEAEQKAIVRTFIALALARSDVAFKLTSGGRPVLELPAASTVFDRFREVLGPALPGKLLGVSSQAPGLSFHGAVSEPLVSFASKAHQWLFVNGRSVKDATLSHAAALASREVLRSDRHPAFALFLDCDPALCDVNVHPQKREVRFKDPAAAHAVVHRGLLAALAGPRGASDIPASRLVAVPARPFRGSEAGGAGRAALALAERADPWDGAVSLVPPPAAGVARSAFPGTSLAASAIGPLRLLGQYRDSFLVAEGQTGLVLVDQHVAHERVRYERILARLQGERAPSQRLLLPVTFEATAPEAALLSGATDLLEKAGLAVSALSGRTFVVSEAPADCPAAAIVPFLRDFLSKLAELPEGARAPDRTRDALAASLACRGAITIHTPLVAAEATRLLADLAACRDPFTCPHGRPAFLTLGHVELLRRFGRPA